MKYFYFFLLAILINSCKFFNENYDKKIIGIHKLDRIYSDSTLMSKLYKLNIYLEVKKDKTFRIFKENGKQYTLLNGKWDFERNLEDYSYTIEINGYKYNTIGFLINFRYGKVGGQLMFEEDTIHLTPSTHYKL